MPESNSREFIRAHGNMGMMNRGQRGHDRQSTDRAISPVVGVVLMVGVTITLAVVAAPIVFGAVDNFGSNAPSADFAFYYEEDPDAIQIDDFDGTTAVDADGLVTITYQRGDNIDPREIEIIAAHSGGNLLNDTPSSTYSEGDLLRPGDDITVVANRTETVHVGWQDPLGDESALLASFDLDLPEDWND